MIGPRKSYGNLIVMKLIRSRFFQTNESALHFVQPQSHLETGALNLETLRKLAVHKQTRTQNEAGLG
jgi:hypothetical protein